MTTAFTQDSPRLIEHRTIAHRMRRQGQPIEVIAAYLKVSTRSVTRYLRAPCPEPTTESPPVRLEDFYLQGACGQRPDLDWASRSLAMRARCKEVCETCPVRNLCREYGLTVGLDDVGIWGGLTAPERVALARQQRDGVEVPDEISTDQGAA